MSSHGALFNETVDTAIFAVREYFRPLVAAARFMKSIVFPSAPVEIANEATPSVEEAKAVLRADIFRRRRFQRMLLAQATISSLVSILAAAISLMHLFQIESDLFVLLIVPVSLLTVLALVRLFWNRERIVQEKTIYQLMKSIDRETAERVVKQISWQQPRRKTRLKAKKPHLKPR